MAGAINQTHIDVDKFNQWCEIESMYQGWRLNSFGWNYIEAVVKQMKYSPAVLDAGSRIAREYADLILVNAVMFSRIYEANNFMKESLDKEKGSNEGK